jgi:hypothetical protein
VWLTGGRCDVLEVGVVVKYDCTMMLSHSGSQEIEDAGRSMVAARSHTDLHIARAIGDGFADGQHHIQRPAALSDSPYIAQITA